MKVYPFIWRNFSELLNYATLFGEDWFYTGKSLRLKLISKLDIFF